MANFCAVKYRFAKIGKTIEKDFFVKLFDRFAFIRLFKILIETFEDLLNDASALYRLSLLSALLPDKVDFFVSQKTLGVF